MNPARLPPEPESGSGTPNRRKLLVSLTPFLVAATLSLFSFGLRTARALSTPPAPPGLISSKEAGKIAADACAEMVGADVAVTGILALETFSVRRQETSMVWDVNCAAGPNEYLVRVNGKPGRIFSINRLKAKDRAPAKVRLRDASEAEARARRLLRVAGTPVRGAKPVHAFQGDSTLVPEPTWHFTYWLTDSAGHRRLISVTIDSVTGTLISLWNPIHAFP